MNPYIASVTILFLELLTWSIIARALISFLPIDQASGIYQMLFRVTEPIIDPFRRFMPNMGMMDLSPLAAILALLFLRVFISGLIVEG